MSKICGYSCEHNKSGVCQISVCDKRTIMSDKTEAQMFTRYIDTTITKLQQENKILIYSQEDLDLILELEKQENEELQQENKQLKEKLSKIETLIINHNCDTGDIYYKYNSRFLKSELKQRILDILNEVKNNE